MRYIFIILLSAICILSCKQPKADNSLMNNECIASILRKDDSLGSIRNNESRKMSLSVSISNYTRSLKQLDFTNCPIKFKTAFKTHIEAWNDMILTTNKHQQLRGEMHDLFDKIENSKDSIKFKKSLKTIWDTWEAIELAKK